MNPVTPPDPEPAGPPPAGCLELLGVMLPWLFLPLVAFSFATTCNQGDDTSWAASLFYASLATLIALPALVLTARRRTPLRWLRLAVPLVTLLPLVAVLDHARVTGFGAHPLCGPDFDDVRDLGYEWLARWYYPLMWAYALALSLAAVWQWLRRPRRSRPETRPHLPPA